MRLKLNSVRTRLTLWYAGALALILLVFGIGVYFFVQENLHAQIDKRLDDDLTLLTSTIAESPTELAEIEAHSLLSTFRVLEGYWPIHVSGGWVSAGLDEAMALGHPTERWVWLSPKDRHYHLKQATLNTNDRAYALAVGYDSEQVHRSLRRLAIVLFVGTPLALVVSLLGGYFLAARALSPIQEMADKARAINADNLADRLAIRNPNDELGHLATVLNNAFVRLEDSFTRLKRFTQDAAHELRTPLAVIRSVGEVGLQNRREAGEYREVIGSMLEEVDRLARLVDGLLTLTRADSGRLSLDRKPEDLAALCQEVTDCLRVLAEDKRQALSFTATEKLSIIVERDTLRLALMNLIANAIRFTPNGGEIRVTLHDRKTFVAIEVQDNGPGIAKEHHARLFERFYRVDRSRSHDTGGTGLGLAIARWAVETNGGRIELDSELNRGSVFRIVLPVLRPHPASS
ncbi:MAG: heavy metal sensor histidine kinase [Gammaproteobacteria bacterium]|nr:heavy metal sensor histidine kinase [Gammaproteobacteria bacterium]